MSCGNDLSRIRAPLDPRIGMPVVTCPACGAACVRRHATALASRRRFRRAFAVGVHLFTRVPVALALVGGTIAMCAVMRQTQSQTGMSPWEGLLATLGFGDPDLIEVWRGQAGPVVIVATICWGTLVGAIVTGGLVHVRRRWAVWASLIGAVLACFGVWSLVEGVSIAKRAGQAGPITLYPVMTETMTHFSTTLAYIAPVLVAGVPLGLLARASVRAREARRFTRLRQRIRAQRQRA